jgi:hypothetical protein
MIRRYTAANPILYGNFIMSKVEFIYGKGGKKVMMARRYADTLQKLGHGTMVTEGYQTRMLTAAPVKQVEDEEPKVSEALREFAAEHGVDLERVVGTGKDGRIKKSDIEAAIPKPDETTDLA